MPAKHCDPTLILKSSQRQQFTVCFAAFLPQTIWLKCYHWRNKKKKATWNCRGADLDWISVIRGPMCVWNMAGDILWNFYCTNYRHDGLSQETCFLIITNDKRSRGETNSLWKGLKMVVFGAMWVSHMRNKLFMILWILLIFFPGQAHVD